MTLKSATKRRSEMDWALTVLILTTAPNFAQSHSHSFILFSSEKGCTEAAEKMKKDLGGPGTNGIAVEVRSSCVQRKG